MQAERFCLWGCCLFFNSKRENAKLKEVQLARQICLLAKTTVFKLPTLGTYFNLVPFARSFSGYGMSGKMQ